MFPLSLDSVPLGFTNLPDQNSEMNCFMVPVIHASIEVRGMTQCPWNQ